VTSSERDVLVEERAIRIIRDDRAAAAFAAFVEAQLRYRRVQILLTGLSKIANVLANAERCDRQVVARFKDDGYPGYEE
jgi:hypothetical protein